MRIRISSLFILMLMLALTMQCAKKEVDVEADIEANKKLTQDVNKAVKAGDFDVIMSYFVDNPMRMNQNEPLLDGKDAMRSSYLKNLELNDEDWNDIMVDVLITGDYAICRGTYTGSYTPKATGKAIYDEGKWVSLRKRQPDGSWKIIWDMWNTDLPLPTN